RRPATATLSKRLTPSTLAASRGTDVALETRVRDQCAAREVEMKRSASCSVLLLFLVACGGDNPTQPTAPVPNVAGRYEAWNMWQVQFYRTNDGFTGSFYCAGSLTLAQSGSRLTGFAVV